MLSSKGATLMELVVVVAVAAIVVGALVFATIASLRNAQFSKNQAQATKLAQEGLELVRTGRDRNKPITGTFIANPVSDWQDVDLWTRISGNCGDDPAAAPAPGGPAVSPTPTRYCYFKVANNGVLSHVGVQADIPTGAETIGSFQRAVILSDEDTATTDPYKTQKTVTVVVGWVDFSGPHESRLTTILRKI